MPSLGIGQFFYFVFFVLFVFSLSHPSLCGVGTGMRSIFPHSASRESDCLSPVYITVSVFFFEEEDSLQRRLQVLRFGISDIFVPAVRDLAHSIAIVTRCRCCDVEVGVAERASE